MRALDCCAGAGGLSLGLQRAGFDVLGVEIDPTAADVHRAQVGPCVTTDLWEYSPHEPARYDLVAGGIPCQSHSTAGKRAGTSDSRGQLYVPFLRIARAAHARAVLIENVRGILSSPSATHGTSIRELVAAVSAAGFEHLEHRVLNAADYGVPQSRHRLFLVAFASADDHARFRWPEPTHSRSADFRNLPRWVTVREALKLPAGEYQSGRLAHAQGWQGMRLLDVDAAAPAVGGSSRPEWLDRPAPCVTATEYKSANNFGSEGALTSPQRRGDVINTLLTALADAGVLDRPATTIDTTDRVSAARHHKSNKEGAVCLSIEQLAGLQAFPPGFTFEGTKKQRHAQIGNAVPPPLAEAVGRSIFAALEEQP